MISPRGTWLVRFISAVCISLSVTLPVVGLGLSHAGVQVLFASQATQTSQGTPSSPPRGQMPALGRPTQAGDEIPLFDFDAYFLGTWTFDGVVPDSPLGPGGELSGKTTFSKVSDTLYDAQTDASGPNGAFTMKARIEYHKDQKTMARQVTDSRGFSYTERAPVGADLGGFYYIYFESDPFTVDGKSVRLKESLRLVSPGNFRVATTISVDGGAYVNLGNPWWRKQGVDPAAAK
jgi:hypothetical protein